MSTLHTNNAPETLTRLLDMGINPLNIADSFLGVLAQRLVRRICETCSSPKQLDPSEQAWVRSVLGEKAPLEGFSEGAGCNQCNHTGYRGRLGVYELLEIDYPLADALRRNDPAAFENAARAQRGYRPLVHNALEFARQGITSLAEAMRLSGMVE